eukprot:TRINITY_DN3084_c0_g2_i2.p1 TRINITY_DN3084_c0_g2~~TRINITY_DN3084_c0_g2_i2.p1  ORF type:complete len:292 (-),score=47.33 TRINITY_DN3084_c0_g2_i2:115-990(-)
MLDGAFQAACGSAASVFADVATHPLSTVKTRLQVQGSGGGTPVYRGVLHGLFRITKSEGPLSLYRGLAAVMVGAAPAQGLYFCGYEAAKKHCGGGSSSAGNFVAGLCAQLCGSLCWVPVDVVKERLQVQEQVHAKVQNFSGSRDAVLQILRHEGLRGLYRGFLVHQMTWAPFNGCFFAIYEKGKGWCINAGYEDGFDNLEPIAQLSCGAAAGVIAAIVTNPMDVLKTRLQVSRADPQMFPYSSARDALQYLMRHEGFGALGNGAYARALWLTPRYTICLAAYESLKAHMSL